eukprot:scaffold35947_cov90-Isochrysis_galbana.AAC.1
MPVMVQALVRLESLRHSPLPGRQWTTPPPAEAARRADAFAAWGGGTSEAAAVEAAAASWEGVQLKLCLAAHESLKRQL